MADIFDLAPAFALAEVLTITDVIGNPPIIPLKKFPIPWANNSRFGLVTLFSGSILSAASIQSNVSILATIAIVNPTTQTSYVDIDEKLGNEKKPIKSLKLFAIGSLTR